MRIIHGFILALHSTVQILCTNQKAPYQRGKYQIYLNELVVIEIFYFFLVSSALLACTLALTASIGFTNSLACGLI